MSDVVGQPLLVSLLESKEDIPPFASPTTG